MSKSAERYLNDELACRGSGERQRKYGFSGFIFKDIKGRVECLEDIVCYLDYNLSVPLK